MRKLQKLEVSLESMVIIIGMSEKEVRFTSKR